MSEQSFTLTRVLDADRDAVWQAWTDPAVAARWWHPAGFTTDAASVRVDPRAGGEYAYVMTSPDGEDHPTGGRYLEVTAPERLRCTWGEPGDDDAPELTIDLVDGGRGRTVMTFRVDGVEPRQGDPDSVHDGWQEAFDALEEVLRGGRADVGRDEIRALVQERVDAIAAQLEAWFDGYSNGPRYEVHDLSVDSSGDLAYAAFVYRVSGTLLSGDAVDMWVRATLIYRRVDGAWRIVHDHESVPFDPVTGLAVLDQGPARWVPREGTL